MSKMTPTYCLAIQLFSDRDKIYQPVNKTDNFKMNTDDYVMPDNVRFRMFCYFQDMGAWDFEELPLGFCLTRNGSSLSMNCTDGYANEELDSMISDSVWNFTRRKPFEQYLLKLTNLTLQIPLNLNNQTGLQMHVMLFDMYGYPKYFNLEFIRKPYFVIPLITNYSTETSPYWDNQCNEMTYSVRGHYYIWKMTALCIGLFSFSMAIVLLIMKRKNHIIESRFIIPMLSTSLYIVQYVTNILLNVFFYDPEWDTLIEDLILIIVMSLHLLQGFRYHFTRLFYSKYYSKRNGLLMKILLSKIAFLIAIILVVVIEGAIVTAMVINVKYSTLPVMYSAITISCGGAYIALLTTGVLIHLIVNFRFVRKLRHPRKIFKWFFLHDDTFGYNGEFMVFVCILILAGLYFGISVISGDYWTITRFDSTRPISKIYTNNVAGHAVYGITKIGLILGLAAQFIFLIGRTFIVLEKKSYDSLSQQKEEMDLFLSKVFNDGTMSIDIMKRFLLSEFKLELLEIYVFLTENPKSNLMEMTKQFPHNSLAVDLYFSKSKLESKYSICYGEATELLVEVFSRLKQTMIYQEEYLEKVQHEIQFVLECIK